MISKVQPLAGRAALVLLSALALVLVAPGVGGGRHLKYSGTPLTNLYVTILSRMGIPVERVGDITGGLEGI